MRTLLRRLTEFHTALLNEPAQLIQRVKTLEQLTNLLNIAKRNPYQPVGNPPKAGLWVIAVDVTGNFLPQMVHWLPDVKRWASFRGRWEQHDFTHWCYPPDGITFPECE
jgi:hypothetical protein